MCSRTIGKFALGLVLAQGAGAMAATPGSPFLGWGDGGSGDVDAPFFYGVSDEYRWAGVSEVLALPDQSVVVVGNIHHNGVQKIGLSKLTPAGILDPGFGAYGGFWLGSESSNNVLDAVLDAEGQILVSEGERVCRFNATSGAPIEFTNGDATCVNIEAMAGFDGARAVGLVARPDGKIWVAAWVYNEGWTESALLRIGADGSLDPTFNGAGFLLIEPPSGTTSILFSGLRRATNGMLVAVGQLYDGEVVAMRFNAGGSVDGLLGQDSGIEDFDSTPDFALIDDPHSPQDDIVVALGGGCAVVKIDGETGLPIQDFGENGVRPLSYGGLPLQPNKIRLTPDGRLLIATVRESLPAPEDVISGHGPFSLVRLLPDGTMDGSFGTSGVSVLDYNGDSDPTSETRGYEMGLVVVDKAVIAARPAAFVYSTYDYDTVQIAKRHLRGDVVFGDGFEP